MTGRLRLGVAMATLHPPLAVGLAAQGHKVILGNPFDI